MAFAPPRPQSIFGRSAPPAPQIDWRLGAQVGKNIGGGVESAIASVTKGWEKFQEAKLKKANQEEGEKALIAMGASPEDAKGFAKHPAMTQAYHTIKTERDRVAAAQELAKAKAAREAVADARAKENAQRQKEEHDLKMDERALEIAPDIFTMGPQGVPVMDTKAYANQSEAVQAAINRLSPEAIFNAESEQQAMKSVLAKAKTGNLVADELTNFEADAFNSLAPKLQDQYLRTNEFEVKSNKDPGYEDLPDGSVVFVSDVDPATGKGRYMGSMKASIEDKLDRFELDMKKVDPGYALTQKDIRSLYKFNEGRIDLGELSALMTIHWSDPSKRAVIKQLINNLGRGPATPTRQPYRPPTTPMLHGTGPGASGSVFGTPPPGGGGGGGQQQLNLQGVSTK